MLSHDIVPAAHAPAHPDHANASYGGHPVDHGALMKSLQAHPAGRSQMMSGSHGRSFSTDDAALNKQILATHAPDIGDLNVRPVLSIVEHIIHLGKPSNPDATHVWSNILCA